MNIRQDEIKNETGTNSDTLLSKLLPLLKSGVEYIGIINEQGRVLDAVYKKPLDVPSGQLEMFFMGIRLQCSMQKDFDLSLGHLSYVLVQRRDLKILSIPMRSFIVIVVTRIKSNHNKIIEKITVADNLVKGKNMEYDATVSSIAHLTI